MPRSRGRKRHPQPTAKPVALAFVPAQGTLQVGLSYNPTGKMEPKDVVSSKEGWSEYTLDDNSVIRIKGVLLDVKKAINQFNAEGDPIYVMQIAMVQQLRAPDKLKKGYTESKTEEDKEVDSTKIRTRRHG